VHDRRRRGDRALRVVDVALRPSPGSYRSGCHHRAQRMRQPPGEPGRRLAERVPRLRGGLLLDETIARCTLCDSTNRWATMNLDGGSEIDVTG
jgi:hypothetical protein